MSVDHECSEAPSVESPSPFPSAPSAPEISARSTLGDTADVVTHFDVEACAAYIFVDCDDKETPLDNLLLPAPLMLEYHLQNSTGLSKDEPHENNFFKDDFKSVVDELRHRFVDDIGVGNGAADLEDNSANEDEQVAPTTNDLAFAFGDSGHHDVHRHGTEVDQKVDEAVFMPPCVEDPPPVLGPECVGCNMLQRPSLRDDDKFTLCVSSGWAALRVRSSEHTADS